MCLGGGGGCWGDVSMLLPFGTAHNIADCRELIKTRNEQFTV